MARKKRPQSPLSRAEKPAPQASVKGMLRRAAARRQQFLARRPHRTLRLTRRRDYRRSLKLPGYWSLTLEVLRTMRRHRRTFAALLAWYIVVMVVVSNMVSQETYAQLKEIMHAASEQGVNYAVSVSALIWGVLMGQFNGGLGSSGQIFSSLFGMLLWLSTVWIMRSIGSGHAPKARDGIYNAGGPVMAIGLLVMIMVVQMIPAALGVIVYTAAEVSGVLDQTPLLMSVGLIMIVSVIMSAYWMTGTFFAMVISTLPGMYPFEALRLAGDLVVGRRLRLLLRLGWLLLVTIGVWLLVLVPMIFLDDALTRALPQLGWLPLVPLTALCLAAYSIMLAAAYIYTLYRKVVDDDSAPA